MSGTLREVAGELWSVYDLNVVSVPPHRPSRRRTVPTRVYASKCPQMGEGGRSGACL